MTNISTLDQAAQWVESMLVAASNRSLGEPGFFQKDNQDYDAFIQVLKTIPMVPTLFDDVLGDFEKTLSLHPDPRIQIACEVKDELLVAFMHPENKTLGLIKFHELDSPNQSTFSVNMSEVDEAYIWKRVLDVLDYHRKPENNISKHEFGIHALRNMYQLGVHEHKDDEESIAKYGMPMKREYMYFQATVIQWVRHMLHYTYIDYPERQQLTQLLEQNFTPRERIIHSKKWFSMVNDYLSIMDNAKSIKPKDALECPELSGF